MSDHALNDIMCFALVDGRFRHGLLTDVGSAVQDFELDAEERDILGTIKADSVTEFARELHTWMREHHRGNGHRKAHEPTPLGNMPNGAHVPWIPLSADRHASRGT